MLPNATSPGEAYWVATNLLACVAVALVLHSHFRDYRGAISAEHPSERLITIARVAIGQYIGLLTIAGALLLTGILAATLPPNPNPAPSPLPPAVRLVIPIILGSLPFVIIAMCGSVLWLNDYLRKEPQQSGRALRRAPSQEQDDPEA